MHPIFRIFKKMAFRFAPIPLAHAIAEQTHRDTNAITRAKFPGNEPIADVPI